MDRNQDKQRKAWNVIAHGFAIVVTSLALFWLVWLLYALFSQGLPWLNLDTLRKATPPPGEKGGLANAIVGSLIVVGMGTLMGSPIGILAGTYLSEFSGSSKTASFIRFVNDVLLSVPSIILGVVVYEVVVVPSGHFSGWAGALALALIVLPIVTRVTEDVLTMVPTNLREAAAALGAPSWKVITRIVYRAARSGIVTGVLLAVARISGETAPLLFTALNNQFWSRSLAGPVANLPVTIFQFAMSPYEDWQHLAWCGALIITVSVLVMNIVVRIFSGTKRWVEDP